LQWLQDPSEINGDNLNSIKRETSRHFRNKKKAYLEEELTSLERTVRTRILETCIKRKVNLRGVTNLEVT
jgi:hypothetical protein